MNNHPDRALELLQSLEDSLSSFPEETQMYYHLLCIQAKDKQYIQHTDDSLINRIVQFYENYNDTDKRMMAYYYQGSVYRDMNDAPRALKAFQQAVDVANSDNDFLPKAYNQMGSLFAHQGLYDESIEINKKYFDFYKLRGKLNRAIYALRDIARMYDMKNQQDSAIIYYKKAQDLAYTDGDSTKYYGILSELGGLYYELGLKDSAKYVLLSVLKKTFVKNKSHIYSILGYVYEDMQQWDSAYYYKRKVVESDDIRRKYYSYKSLYVLEKHKGNYKQALSFMETAMLLQDSISKITQTEAIAKINSLYNYHHTESENIQLRLNKERQKNWTLTLSFISLFACSSCIYLVLYHRQRRAKAMFEQEKREQQEAERYAKSQAAIRDNESKLATLDSLLKDSIKENNLLKQELLQTQQKRLKAQNEEIIQYQKEQELLLTSFKRSELYKEIWLASNSEDVNLSFYRHPEKWVSIQENIDQIYPDFTRNIKGFYTSLSETELKVCWLTKIGISPSGIARVLNLSKQAITNIRSRLSKKLKIKENNWNNFDHFIKNM